MNNLRCAVVKKAVDDWKKAFEYIKKHPENIGKKRYADEEKILKETERFFKSAYFTFWSELDGKEILKQLKRKFYEEALKQDEAEEKKGGKKCVAR